MSAIPHCSQCDRPLQRNKHVCIYCGYTLNQKEAEAAEKAFESTKSDTREGQIEALLASASKPPFSNTGKFIAKILITALSVAMMVFISWVGEWQPLIVILAIFFFSLPIWHVIRKL